jgi:hypothetical protein
LGRADEEVPNSNENEIGVFWEDDPDPTNVASKVKLNDPKDVSSESLQNPTDPDVSFDGHKGKGFQVQVVESYTASDVPEVKKLQFNLITGVKLEGAAKSDSAALAPMVDELVQLAVWHPKSYWLILVTAAERTSITLLYWY